MRSSLIKKIAVTLPLSIFIMSNVMASDTLYVTSNKLDGNTVVAFHEDAHGKFKKIGEYSTGGKGTGDLEVPSLKKDPTHPLLNGDDPLISAYAIEGTADKKHLVTVNPGDGTISLMAVNSDKSLKSVDTAIASDKFPVSVAIFNNHVAVASIGSTNNEGSIATYKISNGKIVSIDNSRRDLAARPSTIRYSSDGEHVIVNELVTGKVKVYAMIGDTLSDEPVSQADSPRAAKDRFQAIPVGFVVRGDGKDDVLLMSEARFLTADFKLREDKGVVPLSPLYSWQTGSVSTYKLTDDGQISVVSADILTGENVEGGEIANCWVVLSADEKTLYAANALSSSISTFDIGENGEAILQDKTAYKDQSEKLFFADISISDDGKRLYQLIGNKGQVMILNVGENGDIEHHQTVDGLPELGSYGMVVL